jgi:hypothetical protein
MRRLLPVVLLALAACAPVGDVEAEAGAARTATARIGETVRLGDVTVRPIAVVEDSRCPRDATCVWAGRLRLRAAVSGASGESELTLGQPFALPRGGTLTLISALPERWQNPPPGTPSGPGARFSFRRE